MAPRMTTICSGKLLILKWLPETGSNRRRRPFQGVLGGPRLGTATPREWCSVGAGIICRLGQMLHVKLTGEDGRLYPLTLREG